MPKNKNIGPKLKTYASWMPARAMEHVRSGRSYGSFAGNNNIDPECWSIWSNKHPELDYVRQWYNLKQKSKRQGDLVLGGVMDELEGLRELVKQLTLERDQLKEKLEEIMALAAALAKELRESM